MSAESVRHGAIDAGNKIIAEHKDLLADTRTASLDKMREWQGVILGVILMQEKIDEEYKKVK